MLKSGLPDYMLSCREYFSSLRLGEERTSGITEGSNGELETLRKNYCCWLNFLEEAML